MKSFNLWSLVALSLCLVAGGATAATTEDEAGDVSEVDKDRLGPLRERVRPVSGNLFLKKGRFELSPGLTLSVKDAFYTNRDLGASLTYHPLETFGIGARFGYSIPVVSGAAQICTSDDSAARGCRLPTTTELNKRAPGQITLVTGVDAQWAPIYGKVSLVAERFLHFDLYGLAGADAIQYVGPRGSDLTFGGNLGLGMRFVINHWLTARTELRDLIYVERAEPSNSLRNQILVEMGVSMFFPTTFDEG